MMDMMDMGSARVERGFHLPKNYFHSVLPPHIMSIMSLMSENTV